MMRIVVLGAAGRMTSVIVEALLRSRSDADYLLADLSSSALDRTYGKLAGHRVELRSFDLFDGSELRSAVAGARLVINGAGPFYKTLAPVALVAIECRADYLDISDDNEACLEALSLHEQAKAAGTRLWIGCGASPGFTNVLAADVIGHLDETDRVEVAWVAGDEGPQEMGHAVAEHAIHIGAGDCLTWRDGRPFHSRSFVASRVLPMGGELGDYRLYETAHPETIMLPRSFPALRDAWCWGGLHPQPLNGLLAGLARAHAAGRLRMDEACDFLRSTMKGERGAWKGWRAALGGMLGQIARSENGAIELARFFGRALRGEPGVCLSGTLARAIGQKNGQRLEVTRGVPIRGDNPFWSRMATCTGVTAAAFATLALETGSGEGGTVLPETWARLPDLVARIEAHGFAARDVVDASVRVRTLE